MSVGEAHWVRKKKEITQKIWLFPASFANNSKLLPPSTVELTAEKW